MSPRHQLHPRSLPLLASVAVVAGLGWMALARVPLPGFLSSGADPPNSPLGARHLALVINGADPLSEAMGAEYSQARGLKPQQVIRVRFPAGRSTLSAEEFQSLYQRVKRQAPRQTQAYVLAWAAPWRVECVSITSAFAFGRIRSSCDNTCRATPLSPYYARGDVRRPWSALGVRPTMLLAATSPEAGRALIARGLAADGTAPPGTAYLLSTSDRDRNRRAEVYPAVLVRSAPGFQVRLIRGDWLRGARDVMLYVTGLTAVPDLGSNRFLPGAVGDHLTSFGGILTGPSGKSSEGGNGQRSALRG
jgi:uncharacterized protein (TIGR03790 family)